MRDHELFDIDVAAEVTTLCGAQLQGSWQVPAEFVRFANDRAASRVEIDRRGGGYRLRCDGALASTEELQDLVAVFDEGRHQGSRQEAIDRVEMNGLSALMWAAGLRGARLEMRVRAGGSSGRLRVRRGKVELETVKADAGPPRTLIDWRCRGLSRRRAEAWLRTALRFVPIPVIVCGRPVERGFPDGLYRMRITEPLPGEIAVTAAGEAPQLWLLEHGVLSARAMVPGFPAFSAAIEMSGVAPAGSSADGLRNAANPFLLRLIDEAVRMQLLLVDRLPAAVESVRARLTTLMLRSADRSLRREQVLASPIVVVREGPTRCMESPVELARRVRRQGGVVAACDPGAGETDQRMGLRLEVSTEERQLLTELLGIRIESLGRSRSLLDLGTRIGDTLARGRRRIRWIFGRRPLRPERLTEDEGRLVEAAAAVGVELSLCNGSSPPIEHRSRHMVGRERPEVRAAVAAFATRKEWLYPSLLALAGDGLEIPKEIRSRWVEYMIFQTRGGAPQS